MADAKGEDEEGVKPSSSAPQTPQSDPTDSTTASTSATPASEDPLARLFSSGEWQAHETASPAAPPPTAPWADHFVDEPGAEVVEDIGAPQPIAGVAPEAPPAQPTSAQSESHNPQASLALPPASQSQETLPQATLPPVEEFVRYIPPPTPRLSPGQSAASQQPAQQIPPHSVAPQPQPSAAPASVYQAQVQPVRPSAPVAAPSTQAAIEPQSVPQRQVVSLAPESLRTSTTTSLPVIVPFSAATVAATSAAEPGQMVRCRACGKSAPAQLALCPNCGRELRPAPSRWLTVGLPAALALLLIALIALQGMRGGPGWFGAPAESASSWLEQLSASLDPQINVIPNNEGAEAAALPADFVAPTVAGVELAGVAGASSEGDTSAFAGVSGASLVGDDGAATSVAPGEVQATAEVAAAAAVNSTEANSVGIAEVAAPAASDPLSPTVAAVVLPTQTVAPTATDLPTETPTPLPTDTLAPTNTPLPATYTVQAGDTALAIAIKLGVSLADLAAYNGMTEQQAAMLQLGQVLRVPGGVVTADAAAGERTYVVRDGDTLVQIARINNSTVAAIMTANNMTQSDVFALRPGQTLIIPAPTPEPAVATAAALSTASAAATASAPTATSAPTSAPTAAQAVATTGPAATAPATAAAATTAPATTALTAGGLRITAPILRAPVSGVSLDCSRAASLQWLGAPNILPDDFYRVHLGFVSGRDDGGNPRITWIVEQSVASTVTQLPLDNTLCSTAPDDYGNQWRWYVDVVTDSGGNKLPVSTPSDIWGFAWN